MQLAELQALGFDNSSAGDHSFAVRCSQCDALVINGVPCHESGCPNEMHECKGCWSLVPKNQKYCEDCIL